MDQVTTDQVMVDSSPWISRVATLAATVVVLFTLSIPSIAEAQTDQERAQEHFRAGAEHFFEERFGRALVEFRQAYQLSPHPMILYNKCLAFIRLENHQSAYDRCYRASEMPGLPEAESLRNSARLAGLTVVITAHEVADAVAATQVAVEDPGPGPPGRPQDDPGLSGMSIAGLATAVGGVGLMTYAGVVHMGLNDKIATIETTNDTAEFDRLDQEIRQDQQRGQIALYAGAGLAVVGTTLFLLGRRSAADEPALTVSPTVHRQGASLSLQRRF